MTNCNVSLQAHSLPSVDIMKTSMKGMSRKQAMSYMAAKPEEPEAHMEPDEADEEKDEVDIEADVQLAGPKRSTVS